MLAFLFFSIVYVIACLPYFLQSFCALLVGFLLPKPSLFTFCLLQVSRRCHFLVFRNCALADFACFVLRAFIMHHSSNGNSFCGVGEVFLALVAQLDSCFFCLFCPELNQFKFTDFACFLRCYIYLCIARISLDNDSRQSLKVAREFVIKINLFLTCKYNTYVWSHGQSFMQVIV